MSAPTGTDDVFALIAGLYAAVLTVPPALAPLAPRDAGAAYAALLAGVSVVTVGVAVALRGAPGLAVRLGAGRALLVPPLLAAPAAALAVAGPVALGDGVTTRTVALATLAGVGGFVLGALLTLMCRTRYAKAVVEQVEDHATWRAGWPNRWRRIALVAGVVLLVASLGALVLGALWGRPFVRIAGQTVGPVGLVVANSLTTDRTYRATDAGLELRVPASRTFYRWTAFSGYTVTEEAVALYPRAPWRLPLYCDREDIDTDAVVAALDRHLPRLSG